MSESVENTYNVAVCRGVQGANCRFAIPAEDNLVMRIEEVVEATGWPAFLREKTIGPIPAHSRLKIAITACPNGCAKPQVADIGIIRASTPALDASQCNCCSLCYRACPDQAITMTDDGPVFASDMCMDCGLCVLKCRERAIHPAEEGYRIMLGGKLGRHPRLATYLEGTHSPDDVVSMVERVIRFYMEHYRKKLRLGTLMDERGNELVAKLTNK